MSNSSAMQLKRHPLAFWNSQEQFWDGRRDEVVANSPNHEHTVSVLPEGSGFLELACCYPSNAQWLEPPGTYFDKYLLESDLRLLQQAVPHLACADAEALPIAVASFDVVISTSAHEQVVCPVQMPREAAL